MLGSLVESLDEVLVKRKQKSPTVSIVGLGMVGTPVKKYLEQYKGYQRGFDLFCFDADPAKECRDDISRAEVVFVCVPTPLRKDGSCDISIVESVVAQCAAQSPPPIVVIKSTVVPGTCEMLARKYRVAILFNPEFLTEANAWHNYLHPDRQIIGATDNAKMYVGMVQTLLPDPRTEPGRSLIWQDFSATEAELIKCLSNVSGYMKVVSSNIHADLCEAINARYERVRSGITSDRRIGSAWSDIHHGAYRGAGGFCFPKDANALIITAKDALAKIPRGNHLYHCLAKGIAVWEAMRDYNRELLASQGLTEEDVSRHDAELAAKIETFTGRERCKKE